MSIRMMFPSFVYVDSLYKRSPKGFREALLEECYTFADLDEAGADWSSLNYIGGYTSYASLDDMHVRSPTFARLAKQIDKHVKDFTESLEMNLRGRSLSMSTCWINIMPQYTHHSVHIHPLSVISGTYYVQTPEGCSGIQFQDPRMECMMASPPRRDECREENQRMVALRPNAGQVVLFESWMRHEVPPNPSEEERISISFNYDWN